MNFVYLVLGDQIVLLRPQGAGLWGMYMFSGTPNLCGKIITIHQILLLDIWPVQLLNRHVIAFRCVHIQNG